MKLTENKTYPDKKISIKAATIAFNKRKSNKDWIFTLIIVYCQTQTLDSSIFIGVMMRGKKEFFGGVKEKTFLLS